MLSPPNYSDSRSTSYTNGAERPSERLQRADRDERLLREVAIATQLLVTAADGPTIGRALALLGTAVDVDRVYIFENSVDPTTGELYCSQRFEWVRDSVRVQIDNPELQGVPYSTLPTWHPRLSAGQPVVGLVRTFSPAERAILEPQDIVSLLVMPITLHAEFWGFVGFDECRSERHWSEGEQAVLLAAAASFGGAIARLRAESALRRREEQYRLVVESVQEVIFQLDHHGRLMFLNPAWQAVTGFSVAESLGLPLVEYLHPEDRGEVTASLAQLYRRQRPSCRIEIRCRTRDGEERWLSLHGHHMPCSDTSTISGTLSDITVRKRYEAQIESLAYFDPLTGLCNRRLLQIRARAALDDGLRYGRRPALLYMDLDRFKVVNDTLGHDAGDGLLAQVAERLSDVAGPHDTLARLGGDEFALLLVDGGETRALRLAHAILASLGQPFLVQGHTVHVGGSIGVACSPDDGATMEDLMKHADIAMYRAKAGGLGVQRFAASAAQYTFERLRLESELRQAIHADQLTLFYQPVLCLTDSVVQGYEALVRWNHPERGLLSPAAFIPLAEECGLIQQLDRWALREAIAQAAHWLRNGQPRRVAVNLSARSLQDAQLVAYVERCLATYPEVAALITVELTETAVMRDPRTTGEVLAQIRRLGMQVALDDFGSGYTSLIYLKQLPVDMLKVDKSFVQGVTVEPKDAGLVEALISLGHGLGLLVVAEGVETAEQLAWVQRAGCDLAQGYLIGRPEPPERAPHSTASPAQAH